MQYKNTVAFFNDYATGKTMQLSGAALFPVHPFILLFVPKNFVKFSFIGT